MRKAVEAAFAVISAHAAFSDAAEAHFARCEMDDGIVDTAATVGQTFVDRLDMLLVLREQIERQGLGLVRKKTEDLLKLIV